MKYDTIDRNGNYRLVKVTCNGYTVYRVYGTYAGYDEVLATDTDIETVYRAYVWALIANGLIK